MSAEMHSNVIKDCLTIRQLIKKWKPLSVASFSLQFAIYFWRKQFILIIFWWPFSIFEDNSKFFEVNRTIPQPFVFNISFIILNRSINLTSLHLNWTQCLNILSYTVFKIFKSISAIEHLTNQTQRIISYYSNNSIEHFEVNVYSVLPSTFSLSLKLKEKPRCLSAIVMPS